MEPMMQLNGNRIDPIYSQAKPNEPIEIGTSAVEFSHEGKICQDVCRVSLQFLPSSRLLFLAQGESNPPLLYLELLISKQWDGKLKLKDRNQTVEALCTGNCEMAACVFVPRRSFIRATAPTDKIVAVTFHLFNWPQFYGAQDYIINGSGPGAMSIRSGRIVLRAGGWNVTIAATDKTKHLIDAVNNEGGMAITHMGRIEREDGAAFSSESLEDFLICLHHFMSFALGRWTGPSLPVGFDSNGSRVFEQWGLPRIAGGPWSGSLSWFDQHHAEMLSQVFPGFLALWKNKSWKDPLSKALYWYLAANEPASGIGVDSGLILAQAALEVLSWSYCIVERKMLSAAAFKQRGLSAADKFRLLASVLGIPLEIPQELGSLYASQGGSCKDGMEAITEIRNGLVHPQREMQIQFDAFCEAWKLSLWYLELAFLRLFRYEGKYGNRLTRRWVGEVADVPWTSGSSL
jgi:hypothetical protein